MKDIRLTYDVPKALLRGGRAPHCVLRGSGRRTAGVRTDAKIVIVGGGVIGLSVAYHLAALGERDVLLIERNTLTSG
ncbi:MAG: FAD-dependent oxidoreductase, partial [Pseudomonadota bacterium]